MTMLGGIMGFMSKSYATWNPADTDASIALSGGNLTAVAGATGYKGVRSTLSKSSGKWYWELYCTQMGGAYAGKLGTANSSEVLSSGIGVDTNGEGYYNAGHLYYNGTFNAYGAAFATADVIGVALDASTGYVTYYKNNVSQGQETYAVTGPYFAAIGLATSGTTITANFGATAFTYTPPTGYNAGLYN